MNSKMTSGRIKIVNIVLNILIVVAAFFLILTVGVMVEEIYSEATPMYSEDSFYYNLEEERYFNMVDAYYRNTMAGFTGNREMKEYYGVAQYFEASSLYQAYTVYGNAEQAGHFLEKMEQVETAMGGWSVAKDPIHKQLGIQN